VVGGRQAMQGAIACSSQGVCGAMGHHIQGPLLGAPRPISLGKTGSPRIIGSCAGGRERPGRKAASVRRCRRHTTAPGHIAKFPSWVMSPFHKGHRPGRPAPPSA